MSEYQTVEVPFRRRGNRQYLDSVQLVQEPWVSDFVAYFPHCFEFSINEDRFYYAPPEAD